MSASSLGIIVRNCTYVSDRYASLVCIWCIWCIWCIIVSIIVIQRVLVHLTAVQPLALQRQALLIISHLQTAPLSDLLRRLRGQCVVCGCGGAAHALSVLVSVSSLSLVQRELLLHALHLLVRLSRQSLLYHTQSLVDVHAVF
jgi:hypothetical protein